MMQWMIVAPHRDDDEGLGRSRWVAMETFIRVFRPASPVKVFLQNGDAIRATFEVTLQNNPDIEGLAFFGHGAEDRLFDANRPPKTNGPALLDSDNLHMLRGKWIHAFACWSGKKLAIEAVLNGISIYVGYRRPLDVGWAFPPSATNEFKNLVTCTTRALASGERDERALQTNASRAADEFFIALESIPDEHRSSGWIWLHALAQQLVDDMVVCRPQQ